MASDGGGYAAVEESTSKPPAFTVSTAATAVAVISSFLFGYSVCVLNSCNALITVVFEWCGNGWQVDCLDSRVSQGLVNAAIYLGATLGALLTSWPRMARLGSRRQIIGADAFFVLGACLCAAAGDVRSLTLGRLLSGVGLGVSAIVGPLYLAEVTPRERRGQAGALHGTFITIGILASIAMGLPQAPPPNAPEDMPMPEMNVWYWRLLLLAPAPLAMLQAFLFTAVLPIDPPSFLVQQARPQDARSLLYRIYGMTAPVGNAYVHDFRAAAIELQFQELTEAMSEAKVAPNIRILDAMCDPWLRFAVYLGFGLAALQQLSGINALMAYSNGLFQEAGVPPASLTQASVAMATANVMASVFSSKVVDNWGRRRLLLLGTFLQALAMALLVIAVEKDDKSSRGSTTIGIIAVFCFSLFVTSFSAGLGAVTWLYLSEIYPMEIRSSALSACGIVNWLSCFSVVFGSRLLSLVQSCKLFGGICGVGFIFVYLWVVETKGCSMEDSPVTPRSGRSNSTLLSSPRTGRSPRADYKNMACEEEN